MKSAVTAIAVLVASGHAHAETPAALVADGQELARRGQIGDAIAKFREADRLSPDAIHACLIGLAYLRGGALPDAELMFASCHTRATGPLPPWVAIEEEALASRLAKAELGTVALTIDPAIVELRVPALLSGAPFPVRKTLHLPPGPHRIVGRSADRREVVGEVTATVGIPRDVTLVLPAPGLGRPDAALRPRSATRSPGPTYLMIGGGAVVIAGVAIHAFAVAPARNRLDDAATGVEYDDHYDAFALRRNLTIGCYAVGAAALITGFVLGRRSSEAPRITAHVAEGGARVAMEWSR